MLNVRQLGRIAVLALSGPVTVASDDALRRELLATVRRHKFVVIDVTGLEAFDWDDLGILVAARRAHRARWGTHMHLFKVVARPGPHRQIIERTHMVNILATYRSLAEALASFPSRRALQIEPDDDAAAVTEVLLEANGFEVVRVRTPDRLPVPAPGDFDLILTEVCFAGICDTDIVRRLRIAWGAPVGVVTSGPGAGIIGAAFVHVKNTDPALLIEQVRAALERPLREYYETIFDALDTPLLVATPDGGSVRPNSAWRALFGLLPGQIPGTLATAFPTGCDRLTAIADAMRSVAGQGGETVIDGITAGSARFRLVASGLAPAGQAPQVLLRALPESAPVVMRDSTASREVLLSLLEDLDATRIELAATNERLRAADRLKDEFVSTVSHELRTPLTTILGSLENLMEGFLGELNGRQQKTVDTAFRNARRLARLIENLLDLPRLERGALQITAEPGDLREPLRHALTDLKALAARAGLALTADLPETPVLVAIDPDRIAQVVINLVDNALRFSRQRVQVAAAIEPDGTRVRLTVADDGPGIPEEERERIFERFAFVESRAERAQTGLGLAIVRGIVDACGGRVWVENVVCDGAVAGACFTVLLPVAASESAPAAEAAP